METLLDFLRFRTFVSPYALIVFYYLGAVGMPGATWLFLIWLRRRFVVVERAFDAGKEAAIAVTRRRDRLLVMGLFLVGFLFMELLWRMMFEYLIAFLQMREVLLQLQEAGRML